MSTTVAVIGASNFFSGSQLRADLASVKRFHFFGKSGLDCTGAAELVQAALDIKPAFVVLAGDVVGNSATPHPRRQSRNAKPLKPDAICQLAEKIAEQCDEVKFLTAYSFDAFFH